MPISFGFSTVADLFSFLHPNKSIATNAMAILFIIISYFNSKNDLVGLDIQAAHDLAKDLKLKLLFVKLNKEDITYAINDNLINLVMSGVILDNNLIKKCVHNIDLGPNKVLYKTIFLFK